MTVTLPPGPVAGTLAAIPSKSAAHRLLIAAALADKPTAVRIPKTNRDIEATIRCLTALGADIRPRGEEFLVTPLDPGPGTCVLDCGESGSTLRFLVPVAGALGKRAVFRLAGRLAQRPMEPLAGELAAHGCDLTLDPAAQTLTVTGALVPGDYVLPGNVSSQFFTGLLFALPLLAGPSTLRIKGELESAAYLDLTLDALARFGLTPAPLPDPGWTVPAQDYRSPGRVETEGDWSNAAPWLCMGALAGSGITVTGLNNESLQGDRAVCAVLARQGGQVTCYRDRVTVRPGTPEPTFIDARNIPDLVPVLAALAAASPGVTRVTGAARLRLKESDRLETTARLLNDLGGQVRETEDGLLITGGARLRGGTADAAGDHRIVMAAAVASAVSTGPVTILGAQAIEKSYPTFWEDLEALGKKPRFHPQDGSGM